MSKHRKRNRILSIIILISLITACLPFRVVGEVKPITEVEEKLEGISEEEKEVLEVLFKIQQEIDQTVKEEEKITKEMGQLSDQMQELEQEIEDMQQEYDMQLDILKKVLVNYQRGGPASYLEILLGAKNLSSFLKSLNIMKDLSHNVNDLLVTLKEGKLALQKEQEKLGEKADELKRKKDDLAKNLETQQKLKKEQEDYLASLLEEREYYQEQLENIKQMWADSQKLFTDIVGELTNIIEAGYFTMEDLNLDFGFFSIQGYLDEETFNQILAEHASLPKTIFHYEDDRVVIEVPEKHLVLAGNFIIAGKSAIQYEVEEGTFYGMPLEAVSVEELFQNGPLLINFELIAGDMAILDFEIDEVYSTENSLHFVIIPKF